MRGVPQGQPVPLVSLGGQGLWVDLDQWERRGNREGRVLLDHQDRMETRDL